MSKKKLSFGIIGASISGLFQAISLQSLGHDVTIFEKAASSFRQGAGMTFRSPAFEYFQKFNIHPMIYQSSKSATIDINNNVSIQDHPEKVRSHSSWDCITNACSNKFKIISPKNIMYNNKVDSINSFGDCMSIQFADKSSFECDIVIGADGLGSKSRHFIDDNDYSLEYVGYAIWRGVVSNNCNEMFNNYSPVIFHDDQTKFIAYKIPNYYNPNESLINWVFYIKYNQNELDNILIDKSGKKHRSCLDRGTVNDDIISGLGNMSSKLLPSSMNELVSLTKEPFFTVVYDYKAKKMAQRIGKHNGILLTGDASFLLRPHITSAVGKAAFNALTLNDLMIKYEENEINLDDVFFEYDRIGIENGSNLSDKSIQRSKNDIIIMSQ